MTQQEFPPGWNAKRVQEVIARYDAQTEDEEAREIEDAIEQKGLTWIAVPSALVDKVRALIAREQGN
jgi:hypothetical protein